MNTSQQTLAGKTALVTGGSRGIGAAIVRALSKQGAQVAFSYAASADKAQTLVQELEADGPAAVAFQADQADADQAAHLVRQTVDRFGGLDILVNNAGVLATGAVDDTSADTAALDRLRAVNVGGVVATVRAAAPRMGKGGRIITIGSVLGARVNFPGLADYSASKFAVAGYTKGWARDLGPKGITVNAIQPGPIDTDMNPDSGDFSEAVRRTTCLGRYGKPEEVAAAVVFLASPEAGFITGTTLDVDGGVNA